MTPRAMTHTHVLVHTYTQSDTDASIAVTRPTRPLVGRHSQNAYMDQRDWDRIPRRILALCAHGDGGIDVWENFCQGRQNPILRPNEI